MELSIIHYDNTILRITGYKSQDISEYYDFDLPTARDDFDQEMLWYCLRKVIQDFDKRLEISKLKVCRHDALLACVPKGVCLDSWNLSKIGHFKCTFDEYYMLVFYLINIYGVKNFIYISNEFIKFHKELQNEITDLVIKKTYIKQ